MNKELIKDLLKKDLTILEYWKAFINDDRFKHVLVILESQRGKYSIGEKESMAAHIQSERNGGLKGWAKCIQAITNTPFKEDILAEEEEISEPSYTETPWK